MFEAQRNGTSSIAKSERCSSTDTTICMVLLGTKFQNGISSNIEAAPSVSSIEFAIVAFLRETTWIKYKQWIIYAQNATYQFFCAISFSTNEPCSDSTNAVLFWNWRKANSVNCNRAQQDTIIMCRYGASVHQWPKYAIILVRTTTNFTFSFELLSWGHFFRFESDSDICKMWKFAEF